MERNEMNTRYKWDLTTWIKDQSAFNLEVKQADALLIELIATKGVISDTLEGFITFIDKLEACKRHTDNVSVYAAMCADIDPDDKQVQENLATAQTIVNRITSELSFIDSEIIQHAQRISDYMQNEKCSSIRYYISEIMRTIPYRKDEATEQMLAELNGILQAPEDTYKSFQPPFKPVLVHGEEAFLNGATYHEFLLNKDVNVRKQAHEHYLSEYERYQNVFMNTLLTHMKGQAYVANIRGFASSLDASLFEDGVDQTLFKKVLYMANHKYHAYLESYFALRKDILQIKEQHVYDIQLDLVSTINKHYDVDDCFTILKKALNVLGEDYITLLEDANIKRWIDVYPGKNKRSGAYSWGTYDSAPYILMNYHGDYDSLSTLAHELGHSLHSYYANTHNRPLNAGYRIFVAEVASTVNEVLLNQYLLKTATDKHYKAYLLSNMLNQMVGTLYRQPMYAQFEADLYYWIEQKEAISSHRITNHWRKLSEKYYGDSVILDGLQPYSCYTIPHFYYNFYVYKYSLGMATAISFAKRIQEGNVEAYKTFLTKGGSEAPIDQLIHAGIDPRKDDIYDDAFTYFKNTLEQLKAIMQD